jgi:hypothetical protein
MTSADNRYNSIFSFNPNTLAPVSSFSAKEPFACPQAHSQPVPLLRLPMTTSAP